MNDENIFLCRLAELKKDFQNAKYPTRLIDGIMNKVKSLPRSLVKNSRVTSNDNIILTGTYFADTILRETVKEACKDSNVKIKYVSETGPKLKNILSNLKYISIGNKFGFTSPCGNTRCASCHLMSGLDSISSNGKTFKTGKGNCKTRNFIYGVTCKICDKKYVGKSTQLCHKRINSHRAFQKKYSENRHIVDNLNESEKDKYSLATHLHIEHGIIGNTCLDDNYNFTILEKCTPSSLDVKEHLWIQKIRTLIPHGLNLNSPLGFPLL